MSQEEKSEDEYSGAQSATTGTFAAPDLPYQPRDPKAYRPKIGMIACGGITQSHCRAYKAAGYDVVMLCDLERERAEKRRDEFFPDAEVTTDYRDVLNRSDIEVVDIATHPKERLPLIEAALRAKKHVLSQKPFVLSLDDGERLADLADAMGVKFAVNQNGRWAPWMSYLREAVKAGLVGDVFAIHTASRWDHSWTKGTPFENIYDLVLYDFSIHWFDFASTLLGDRPVTSVFATRAYATGQDVRPPLLAQVMFQFDGGQGSLIFDASVKHGAQDVTFISGTEGTLTSSGPHIGEQTVTLTTDQGSATPRLQGTWFPDGFHGTMGELLCAIEEDREPMNSARNNLRSLAFCFAAIQSATDGTPKVPGQVRQLPVVAFPDKEGA